MSDDKIYNPAIHHRRSIRIPGYDYSHLGAYFITICTHDRKPLFGEIKNGEMILNKFGLIAQNEWERSAFLRDGIELGEFVVMPNHFHGIIILDDVRQGTARRAPTEEQFGNPIVGSIPTIVRSYKSAVTKWVNVSRDTPGAPVWQRNYYEHIIRNETTYQAIGAYVTNNPAQWEQD